MNDDNKHDNSPALAGRALLLSLLCARLLAVSAQVAAAAAAELKHERCPSGRGVTGIEEYPNLEAVQGV